MKIKHSEQPTFLPESRIYRAKRVIWNINKPERVFGLQARCRELDIFKILEFFLDIWGIFFWRISLGGIFFGGISRNLCFCQDFWVILSQWQEEGRI